ncbi:MAG TPA: M48 family metallopeptidase [Actinomycetota bacterium]|nr:M48 family metallopeptidase [Actinomycetota bacterium]
MYEQIASNRRRTVLIVAIAVMFAAGGGYLLGRLLNVGILGLVVALVIAAAMSFYSYRYGDRLVLRAARARKVTPEEEPRLHNIVEGLSLAAGLPKPDVYIVPERALNAFATGRDPTHSSIAVTQGLLDSMNRLELEGVIAHEMAHVQGRDVLLGTIVGTLVGAVVLMAEFMLRIFWWGGGRSRRVGSLPLVLVGFAFAAVASLFAQLIRVAVSRRREYLADAQGALFTRYPPGLASALRKIAADNTPMKATNNATAHLWLKQPSRTPGEGYNWFETMFSTHPPIGERIRILEEM